MADINSPLEIGVTTGPIRGSRKIHVGPLGVAMREIHLEPSSGEPPLRVYDPSGPYTDSNARIDIMGGLPEPHGHVLGVPVEGHRRVGAEPRQCGQPVSVATGSDDTAGAEEPRHLDGEPAGVAGGAQNEDVLPGPEVDALTQSDP